MEEAYRTITIRNKERTFESASTQEGNFLHAIRHQTAAAALRAKLAEQRDPMADVIRHHLGMDSSVVCAFNPEDGWFQGGFNFVIPIEIRDPKGYMRVVFRCPMPHKLAESRYPGTVDDKVLCETGTYVYVQENCPDIRIPKLHAFGLSGVSDHFTHVDNSPLYYRAYHAFRRWVRRKLEMPVLSNYFRNTSIPAIDTPYMLLEYIGPDVGEPLMYTWSKHMADPEKTNQLYKSMSRIMLSLCRLPQASIGSFRFNPVDATVSLSARPLTCSMMLFENGETPRTIHPTQTYENTDSFVSDMLTMYDNNLLHDPHAARDGDDVQERMTIRAMLRLVAHRFILPERRNGPFLLQMTDFHQSNIMVDEDWNVTCLFDLEWISSLPVEWLSVPHWLTGCSIDTIRGDEYVAYEKAHQCFLEISDNETSHIHQKHDVHIAETIRQNWESKRKWFFECIDSINGWLFIFEDHLMSLYTGNVEYVSELKNLSTMWHEQGEKLVERKVAEEEAYQAGLRTLFLGEKKENRDENVHLESQTS